jgi:proteic killer suppression protein
LADEVSEDLFLGNRSRAARRCLPPRGDGPPRSGSSTDSIGRGSRGTGRPTGSRLEALKGDYAGYFSIRINDQYRIVFRFGRSDARDVQIVDYH